MSEMLNLINKDVQLQRFIDEELINAISNQLKI